MNDNELDKLMSEEAKKKHIKPLDSGGSYL
jgi:hypothetical protein